MFDIGIIGSGQLAKLTIQKCVQWGISTIILSNSQHAPASSICTKQIIGSYQDQTKIRSLADQCRVLTWELENINVDVLLELKDQGKIIIPDPKCLQIIQNKCEQKLFYQKKCIPIPEFQVCSVYQDLNMDMFYKIEKVVVKPAKGGYDGKGVFITEKNKLPELLQTTLSDCDEFLVEEFLEDPIELSILVATKGGNNTVVYEPSLMVFNKESNLLDYQISPGQSFVNKKRRKIFSRRNSRSKKDQKNRSKLRSKTKTTIGTISDRAKQLAVRTVKAFESPGIFAVELFLNKNGELLVNEVSPRPHNSGHQTIEANVTSQYEQLLRICLDLNLGSPELRSYDTKHVLINWLGPLDFSGLFHLNEGIYRELSLIENLQFYNYCKLETRPMRKLGHVTVTLKNDEKIDEIVAKIKNLLRYICVPITKSKPSINKTNKSD
jgi:5-(carboxyamino)imidazole ribonucleotide synthase